MRILFHSMLLLFLSMSGCTSKNTGSSAVSISFPTVAQLGPQPVAQKINGSNLDWSKACFMVNVTASDIASLSSNKCDVPSGSFAGSVPPGGQLKLQVAKGSSRKVEVLAYFRNSAADPCQTKPSINQFDPSSTAAVGSTVADLKNDTETVAVSIALPSSSDSLIAEYGLPSFCGFAATTVGDGAARIVSGRGEGGSTHFKVDSVVTSLPAGVKASTHFVVKFSHQGRGKE